MNNQTAAYNDNVHFRVPSDFMADVHLVARSKGITASNFMRMAILDAVNRYSVASETPKHRGG